VTASDDVLRTEWSDDPRTALTPVLGPSPSVTHLGVAVGQYRGARFLDIVGASVAIALCAIPTIVLWAIVRVTSPGPAVFRQQRIGRGGREFTLYKLRTMRCGTHEAILADAEEFDAYAQRSYKLEPDDPRITGPGRWLRRLSLDEIPQLWNVLRGDMALVGIRPAVPAEFDARSLADRQQYVAMRPGLTGLWQVDGRSSLVPHERTELDRWYAANRSLALDLRILCRTPLAVLHISRAH
jgi:lipopolysaccharide/colanic/teichoic acid biosynthesis glycosyltransferase